MMGGHSARSTTMGSARVARNAGIKQAAPATPNKQRGVAGEDERIVGGHAEQKTLQQARSAPASRPDRQRHADRDQT